MASVLGTDKKIAAIGALAEGSNIRSVGRITGVNRDTIMSPLRTVGAAILQEYRDANAAQA
jgi:hypothetical protein